MSECIIPMKSPTAAKRAQRALSASGIKTQLVSIDPTLTRRGCAFGLSLACRESSRGTEVLDRRGITHGEVIGGYGSGIS